MNNLLLKNITILDHEKKFSNKCNILIVDGIISDINTFPESQKSNYEVFDGTAYYVSPGFIDLHCHLRDPGFTHKEDLVTGGQAALAGGFTTICPLANTNPVIDNTDILQDLQRRSKKVDGPEILPYASITKNLSGKETTDLVKLFDKGAVSFSDDGKWVENKTIMIDALKFSKIKNSRIALHEEHSKYSLGSPESEIEGIRRDLKLLEEYGGKIHIMHVSLKKSCQLIKRAKTKGLDVTCEVTPHHLFLNDTACGNQTNAKCSPPLRSEEDRKYLNTAFKQRIIDIVATDHAPHTIEEKNQLYEKAPNGIIGFQSAFSILSTLAHNGNFSIERVIEGLTIGPTRIYSLKNLGIIKKGGNANLTILNLDKEFVFNENSILSKSKNSPFIGSKFKGGIKATIHEGRIKYLSNLL
jgi:dihydroorotase